MSRRQRLRDILGLDDLIAERNTMTTPSPDHTLFHLLLQHFTDNTKATWGKNELLKTLNELYIQHLEARQ